MTTQKVVFSSLCGPAQQRSIDAIHARFRETGKVEGVLQFLVSASAMPTPEELASFKETLVRLANIDLGGNWAGRFQIGDPIPIPNACPITEIQRHAGTAATAAQNSLHQHGFWTGIVDPEAATRVVLEGEHRAALPLGRAIATKVQRQTVDVRGAMTEQNVDLESFLLSEEFTTIGRNKQGRFATRNIIELPCSDVSNNQAVVYTATQEEINSWMVGYGATRDTAVQSELSRPTMYILRGPAVITVYHTERLQDGDVVVFGKNIPYSIRFRILPAVKFVEGGRRIEGLDASALFLKEAERETAKQRAVAAIVSQMACFLIPQDGRTPGQEVGIAPDGTIQLPNWPPEPGATLELRPRSHPNLTIEKVLLTTFPNRVAS